MDCITSITPSICRLMEVEPPCLADGDIIQPLLEYARSKRITRVERCLVYAPDAIGAAFYGKHSEMFIDVVRCAPLQVELCSVYPPKTPVCFASMFTGARPEVHGIRHYEKPVLVCDTLFDALVRAGKKVAIVTVADSSIDRIFRNRPLDYFSETYDEKVTARTMQLLDADEHDVIVAYHQEYDDTLHRTTPESEEAVAAARNHVRSFAALAEHFEAACKQYNRLLMFTPDHGGHIDPETGKGTHGSDIPEDMQIYHYYHVAGVEGK